MSNSHILLLEDGYGRRGGIKDALGREGYKVAACPNGQDFMRKLDGAGADVILLDLMFLQEDGFNLISRVRQRTSAPIIVISDTNDVMQKLAGLERGADDFLCAPFQFKELSMRIKVLLRRNKEPHDSDDLNYYGADFRDRPRFGSWSVDTARMQIFNEEGCSGNLTVKEFRLLEALMKARNRVLTRAQLLDITNMNDLDITDRAIDTQIARLRRKLGVHDACLIESVRGVGYVMAVPHGLNPRYGR